MPRVNRRTALLPLVCLSPLLTACATMDAEAPIERRDVSPRVIGLVEEAFPGIVIGEIEVEIEDGVLAFEIEGRHEGVEIEIEATPDGDDIVLDVEIVRDEEANAELEPLDGMFVGYPN